MAFQKTVWVKKDILNELYLRDDEEACQMGVKFTVHEVRDKSAFTMPGTGYIGLESKN